MSTKQLLLEDGICRYTLNVSEEDYDRAQNDIGFANSLLFHAQVNQTSAPVNVEIEQSQQAATVSTQRNVEVETPNSNKIWQYDEVKCLISSMESHIEDLHHPKKKRHVYENISNDLSSSGFNATALQCQSKWKSLVRSYKISKDNHTKTGRSPSRFHFFNDLDLLLGDKPSSKCNHTLESNNNNVLLEVEENDENQGTITEESTSSSECFKKSRRRKNKTKIDALLELKKEEYERREARHKEMMNLERQKVHLLEKMFN